MADRLMFVVWAKLKAIGILRLETSSLNLLLQVKILKLNIKCLSYLKFKFPGKSAINLSGSVML